MTPYAQMIAAQMRPEAQATFAYEYQRYAKDPTLATVLTIVLGIVGGESYYLGNYVRGILMSLAAISGIALIVTVPMWIVRCFTITGECENYNDYLAYSLAMRYWPQPTPFDNFTAATPGPPPPTAPPAPPQNARAQRVIGGLPMTVTR